MTPEGVILWLFTSFIGGCIGYWTCKSYDIYKAKKARGGSKNYLAWDGPVSADTKKWLAQLSKDHPDMLILVNSEVFIP